MIQMVSPNVIEAATAKQLASGLVIFPALRSIYPQTRHQPLPHYKPDGRRISDQAKIARVNALAIPPAYTDVVISTNPYSHLQAIGTDARGR